jgi:hypothetical protein
MFSRTLGSCFLALTLSAVPSSATITYSYCSSGCSASSGGSYATWQTAPGSSGLTFSMSPLTFAPGGLNAGVYTDGTGTIFTGYNGANTSALNVSGTALVQSVGGSGSGIQLTLPANTYAVAFVITVVSGFANPLVEIGDRNLNNANYQIVIPSSSSPQFFAIVSDTPLTSLFVGNNGSGGALQINSFELGQQTAAPEVSTLALIGSGLVGISFLRRRRIHKPNGTLA